MKRTLKRVMVIFLIFNILLSQMNVGIFKLFAAEESLAIITQLDMWFSETSNGTKIESIEVGESVWLNIQLGVASDVATSGTTAKIYLSDSNFVFTSFRNGHTDGSTYEVTVKDKNGEEKKVTAVLHIDGDETYITIEGLTQGDTAYLSVQGYFTSDSKPNESVTVSGNKNGEVISTTLTVENVTNQIEAKNSKTVEPESISYHDGDTASLAKDFPIKYTIGTTIEIPDEWEDSEEITSLTITDTLYFGDGMYLAADTNLSKILTFGVESLLTVDDFTPIYDNSEGHIIGLKLTKELTGSDIDTYLKNGETIEINYDSTYVVITGDTTITNTLDTTYDSTNYEDVDVGEVVVTTVIDETTGADFTTQKVITGYSSSTGSAGEEWYYGYFVEGDTITYTITAKNNGDETGSITLTDTIPYGTTFVEASGDYNKTGDPVTSVSWTFDSVEPGEEVSVTIKLEISSDDTFDLKNVVSDGEDVIESMKVPVHTKEPNLTISKTAESSSGLYTNPGDTVTYTITVSNTGEKDITTSIEDYFPEELEFVSAYNRENDTDTGTYDNGTITWYDVTIGAGETITYIVKGTVKNGIEGNITNTVYVDKDGNYEKSDEVTTSVFDEGVIADNTTITKEVDDSYVSTGDTITYTIKLTNNGDAYYVKDLEEQKIVVTDALPSEVEYVSSSWYYKNNSNKEFNGYGSEDGGTVTFTITENDIETIDAYSTIYFYITVNVTEEASSDNDITFVNTATVKTFDKTTNEVEVTILSSSGITVEKYVSAIYDDGGNLIFKSSELSSSEEITTDVEDGYTVTYNVKITNNGTDSVTLTSEDGSFLDTFSGFKTGDYLSNLTIYVYDSNGELITTKTNASYPWESSTKLTIDISEITIKGGDYIVLEYSLITADNFTVGTNSISNDVIEADAQEVTNEGEITKSVGLIEMANSYSSLNVNDLENIETYDSLSVIATKLESNYLVYKLHVETGTDIIDTFTITDTIDNNLKFVTLSEYDWNGYGNGPVIAIVANEVYSQGSYSYKANKNFTIETEDKTLTIAYTVTDTSIVSLSFDVYYLVTLDDDVLEEFLEGINNEKDVTAIDVVNNVTVTSTKTDDENNPLLDETDTTTVNVNDGTLYPGLAKEYVASFQRGDDRKSDDEKNVYLSDASSSTNAGAGLVWQITVSNEDNDDGKVLRNYTVTDTLPDSYYFDTNYLTGQYAGKYYPSIVIYDSNGEVKKSWIAINAGTDENDFILPKVYNSNGELISVDDYDYSDYSTIVWEFNGEKFYLQPGDYMVITYSTVTDNGSYGAFLNTVELTTVQDFDKENISEGTLVDDNTIESTDFANIYSYMTTSYKEIEYNPGWNESATYEQPDQDTGISTRDATTGELDNYVQGVQGEKVKYTLNITNESQVNVGNLCIIDRLPYVGDIGVIADYARDSAFEVKWSEFICAYIVETDGTTTREIDTSKIKISFSDNKTDTFVSGSGDWYGLDDVAEWYDVATDSTVNVRFMIDYDSADDTTYLKPGETLKICFYGIVPEYVENTGEENIAWNNFAYGYNAYSTDGNTALQYCIAEPAKVGVWVAEKEVSNPGTIKIEKKYDADDGEETTVYFVLYKYNESTEKYSSVVSLDVTAGVIGVYTFENLEPGTKYIVYETDKDGNILEETNDWYDITGQGEEIEMTGNDTEIVEITNKALEEYTGSIKISKEVEDYDGTEVTDDDTTYYFVIKNSDGYYVYDDEGEIVKTKDFSADVLIEIKAGEDYTISGLEIDKYKIYEVTTDGTNVNNVEDIGYSVTFSDSNIVEISRSDGNEYVHEVTATNTLEQVTKTSYVAEKVWEDFGNKDNSRPTSITLQLKANGENYGETVTLSAGGDNEWQDGELTYEWTDLPIYSDEDNIQKITYTVIETSSEEGYTASYDTITDGKTVITNKYNPLIEVAGTKKWEDDSDTSNRPSYITVNLWQNDKCIKYLKVSAADEWSYSFKELPKYDTDGKAYTYTITEDTVSGYTATIDGYDIINTLNTTPASETVNLNVTKTWVDSDSGTRPESITVNLLQNGEIIRSVNITENDGWEYTFEELPKYDEDNEEYIYTITENEVANYQTSIEGTKITNTYTKEETPESPEEDEPDTPSEDEPDTPSEDESENPSEDKTENSNEEQSEDSETTEESNSEDSEETETTVSQSVKTGDNIIISFMTLMISFGIEVVIRRLHMKNKD